MLKLTLIFNFMALQSEKVVGSGLSRAFAVAVVDDRLPLS